MKLRSLPWLFAAHFFWEFAMQKRALTHVWRKHRIDKRYLLNYFVLINVDMCTIAKSENVPSKINFGFLRNSTDLSTIPVGIYSMPERLVTPQHPIQIWVEMIVLHYARKLSWAMGKNCNQPQQRCWFSLLSDSIPTDILWHYEYIIIS